MGKYIESNGQVAFTRLVESLVLLLMLVGCGRSADNSVKELWSEDALSARSDLAGCAHMLMPSIYAHVADGQNPQRRKGLSKSSEHLKIFDAGNSRGIKEDSIGFKIVEFKDGLLEVKFFAEAISRTGDELGEISLSASMADVVGRAMILDEKD
ncbi:hypothetical protein OAU50_07335 [Planctomycetota bacterium]|nr:hypothetical protein [Planctomycetota bacterium]